MSVDREADFTADELALLDDADTEPDEIETEGGDEAGGETAEAAGPADIFVDEPAETGERPSAYEALPAGYDPPEITGVDWSGDNLEVYQLGATAAAELGISADQFNELASAVLEQLQAAESGIPATPELYKAPAPEGITWADEDKPILSSFLGAAHKVGLPQVAIDGLAEWYAATLGEQTKAQKIADQTDAAATRQALARDWGAEAYRANLAEVKSKLAALPDGFGGEIRGARMPSGKLLVNDARFIAMLTGEKRIAPTPSDRKAQIQQIMRTDMSRYWSEGLDKEMIEILAREQK